MSNKTVFAAGVVTGVATVMAVMIGGSLYIARKAGVALEKAIASGELFSVPAATPVTEPVAPGAE